MKFKVNEKRVDGRIYLEVLNLITLCPHRKYDKEDITNLRLIYKPGKYEISREALTNFISKEIEDKEIAMELIPLRILNYSIESTVMNQPASRYASPEEIEIDTISEGKVKKFKISTKVRFSRVVVA